MELSRRFKDRPKTPKEEVLYWTEYVIKYKRAHHLKPGGLQLYWYQYFLIDVIVFILLIGLAILSLIFCMLSTLKSCLHSWVKYKKE